jgi:cytochrome c oxidase subunit IV
MPPGFLRLLLAWIALILLWGLEFGISFIQMPPSIRPVILLVAFAMLAVVAVFFMHLGSGPTVVRGFAVAGVFWMIVLIGLGSMDPMTRVQYFTTVDRPR